MTEIAFSYEQVQSCLYAFDEDRFDVVNQFFDSAGCNAGVVDELGTIISFDQWVQKLADNAIEDWY